MGVIQVESFDVDVSSNGQLYNLVNTVPSTSAAFFRNTNNRGYSGGPLGTTSNSDPDDMSGYGFLTSTTQVEFGRLLNTVRMSGEVWRYTGSPGGADEFIVRDRLVVTLTNGGPSTGNVVSGVVDRNKCVCFITGQTSTQTSRGAMAEIGSIAYLEDDGTLTVERGSGSSTLTVYVTVVEFTGSNWIINYSKFPFGTNSRNCYTDSRGDTGATSSIDWSSSIIIEARQSGGNGSNDAIEDLSFCAEPGTASTVSIITDSTSANTGNGFVYIIENAGISIGRTTANKTISNNNTYVTETFPGGVSISNYDESCIEWTVFSDGTGTAHGRGSLNARLTNSTTIQSWVHRSGNTGTYRYGAANLSGLLGVAVLTISSVDGDDILSNNQTGVIISGVEFGSVQGSGTVTLAENADGSGTTVSQAVTNWTDTAITINFTGGALSDSNAFIIVTNDSSAQGNRGVQVGVPPISAAEAALALGPDHFWEFDGDLLDTAGVDTRNASNNIGSPGFTSVPLTREAVQSFTIDSQSQRIEIADSNFMNLQSETTRSMGGWIRISQVQDSFVCFYEEGGGVNNLAFFMGMGGILIAQLADTSDDNVHAYSDFKLQPNRNYHIMFRFDYNAPSPRFELLVDGVLQSSTFGNPLTATDLDAHSGDVGWGDAEGTLEVFGTDITFPAAVTSYYQLWGTWTTALTDSQIRSELFEQAVRGDIQITSGTQASMQAQLDVYSDTIQPNSDCTFRIASCTDGDFTLDFDNITFDDGTTLQIQYLGNDVLTANNLNGSNLDPNKISTLNAGTVNIVTPSQVTIAGLVAGSEVRIFEAGTTTEIGGIESSGTSFSLSVEVASVDVSVLSLGFQNLRVKNVISTSDVTVNVVQRVDRQYGNP